MEKKVKILLIQSVTDDVKRFVVKKPVGYKFAPGQATELSLNKKGFRKEKRPFTFTSLHNDFVLEFIIKIYPVKKYPNHEGFTEAMDRLKVGDELIIREPWGTINYQGPGVFIAGGAGITPFIAILRQLKERGEIKGNSLIFSNKRHKDIILERELREIFNHTGNLIFTLTQEKKAGYEYGRINLSLLKKEVTNFSQNFYLCGPKKMVVDLRKSLSRLGAKSKALIFEE